MDDYWYKNRDKLTPGMAFETVCGDIVELDRSVPGDGSKWYVLDYDRSRKTLAAWDNTVEPGELKNLITLEKS
jgi:hypothetical protein